MSQQINLLRPKARPIDAAILPIAGVVVVLVAVLVYAQILFSDTARLRDQAKLGEQKLQQLQNTIAAMQKEQAARGDAASLTAEIAVLRLRVDAVNQMVIDMGNGTLGKPEGYSRHLTTLASVSEDGLWVTSFTVSKGGSAIALSGRALRSDSVMQYARRLNQSFGPYGVRLNSLEMTPENLSTPGATAAPGLATVAFRLS